MSELLSILAEVCRGRGRGVCARLQEIWRAHAGGRAMRILEGFSVQFSVKPRYFRFENPNPKVKKWEQIYPPNKYIYILPKNFQSHLREKSKRFSPRFSQLAPGSWQQWRGWRGVLDSQGQRRNSVTIPWHFESSPAKGTKKYLGIEFINPVYPITMEVWLMIQPKPLKLAFQNLHHLNQHLKSSSQNIEHHLNHVNLNVSL